MSVLVGGEQILNEPMLDDVWCFQQWKKQQQMPEIHQTAWKNFVNIMRAFQSLPLPYPNNLRVKPDQAIPKQLSWHLVPGGSNIVCHLQRSKLLATNETVNFKPLFCFQIDTENYCFNLIITDDSHSLLFHWYFWFQILLPTSSDHMTLYWSLHNPDRNVWPKAQLLLAPPNQPMNSGRKLVAWFGELLPRCVILNQHQICS